MLEPWTAMQLASRKLWQVKSYYKPGLPWREGLTWNNEKFSRVRNIFVRPSWTGVMSCTTPPHRLWQIVRWDLNPIELGENQTFNNRRDKHKTYSSESCKPPEWFATHPPHASVTTRELPWILRRKVRCTKFRALNTASNLSSLWETKIKRQIDKNKQNV